MFTHIGKIISGTAGSVVNEHRGVLEAQGALEELFREMATPQLLARACTILYREKQKSIILTTPNKSTASNVSLELARLAELLRKRGLAVETIIVR